MIDVIIHFVLNFLGLNLLVHFYKGVIFLSTNHYNSVDLKVCSQTDIIFLLNADFFLFVFQ